MNKIKPHNIHTKRIVKHHRFMVKKLSTKTKVISKWFAYILHQQLSWRHRLIFQKLSHILKPFSHRSCSCGIFKSYCWFVCYNWADVCFWFSLFNSIKLKQLLLLCKVESRNPAKMLKGNFLSMILLSHILHPVVIISGIYARNRTQNTQKAFFTQIRLKKKMPTAGFDPMILQSL